LVCQKEGRGKFVQRFSVLQGGTPWPKVQMKKDKKEKKGTLALRGTG